MPEPLPADIWTEPDASPDTLAHLGPLAPLAGVWEGVRLGHDEHPVEAGTEVDEYLERFELQPIDPQTNGPQLFYGLRYHTHIVRPGEVVTFHDQVGYFLWEPAAERLVFSLTIPRGQVVLAGGHCAPDATSFEVTAALGSPTFGICSNPFLDVAYRTVSFRMRVDVHPDGTWSYDEDTVLEIPNRDTFHHVDRNTLRRVATPTPNPLAAAAAETA